MLPTKATFLSTHIHPLNSYPRECGICTRSFDRSDNPTGHQPVRIDGCHHIFGHSCILRWFNSNSSDSNQCPSCRQPLFAAAPQSQGGSGSGSVDRSARRSDRHRTSTSTVPSELRSHIGSSRRVPPSLPSTEPRSQDRSTRRPPSLLAPSMHRSQNSSSQQTPASLLPYNTRSHSGSTLQAPSLASGPRYSMVNLPPPPPPSSSRSRSQLEAHPASSHTRSQLDFPPPSPRSGYSSSGLHPSQRRPSSTRMEITHRSRESSNSRETYTSIAITRTHRSTTDGSYTTIRVSERPDGDTQYSAFSTADLPVTSTSVPLPPPHVLQSFRTGTSSRRWEDDWTYR